MKQPLDKLKDVIKALDLLEGTEAKISVKVPTTQDVKLFLADMKSKDFRFSYVSEEDYHIVVTVETKLCRFQTEGHMNL